MSNLLIFYVCFLNFFNTPILSKIKYIYYILISFLCLIHILFNLKNIKIIKKNNILRKFLMYMMFSCISTIVLCWNGSNLENLTAYIRVWLIIPIIGYIYIYNKLDIISGLIKYSFIINIISVVSLIYNLGDFGRIQSIFSHPNFYSFYLIMIIICTLYLIRVKSIKSTKGYIYIGINIFMMVASGSKTAVILLVIISLYQYIKIMENKSVSFKAISFITIISIFIIIVLSFGDILSDMRIFDINHGLQNNQINSFDWRILKWKRSFNVWNDSLFGILFGYGYRSELIYGMSGYSMHNEYLRIIFNTGIIGIILALNVLIGIINKVRRFENEKKVFYTSVLMLIMIGSLSENLFVASETMVMYLVVIFSIDSFKFKTI